MLYGIDYAVVDPRATTEFPALWGGGGGLEVTVATLLVPSVVRVAWTLLREIDYLTVRMGLREGKRWMSWSVGGTDYVT